MRRVPWLASCVVLAACTRKPTVTSSTAPVAVAPSDPQSTAPPEPVDTPPALSPSSSPRVGPMHREAPIVFQPSSTPAQLRRLAKSVRMVDNSDDGRVRAELGCTKGGRLVEGTRDRPLPLADAQSIVLSPRGDAAAFERGGKVVVVDLPDTRTRGSFDASLPIWLDDHTLAFRHGCQWVALGRGDDPPQPLGESCGDPVRVEDGRARLWLAEHGDAAGPTRALVGLELGQPAQRVELGDGVSDVVLSHDAAIVCGTFVHDGHPLLQCRPREGGSFERVAQDVHGVPRFAPDAPRLAFTVGSAGEATHDLFVADFSTKLIRKLGRVAHQQVEFLPGSERVVAYGGARGLAFELDLGVVVPFGDDSDAWVGLWAAHGDADGFVAARRTKRCNELVHVQLPGGGTPTTGEPVQGE